MGRKTQFAAHFLGLLGARKAKWPILFERSEFAGRSCARLAHVLLIFGQIFWAFLFTHKHRPQTAPSEQMHMQMKDFLSSILVTVDQQAIAAFRHPFLFGNFFRCRE